MEKELNRYRGTLKTQNWSLAALILVVAALVVLSALGVIAPAGGDARWADMWNGFLAGVSSAAAVLALFGIVLNVRAMKDEARLKKLYIKEHDERAQEIARRAGGLSYWFETLGLLLGIIVGGYFEPMISFACFGCLMYICLVRLALKFYYCKKL